MQLPLNFSKHTGDLDEMVKRKNIRALVMLNPVAFFYDQGQPHGIMYETMEDFQRFANQKLKLGNPGLKVTFLPVTPAQAEAALTSGMGDVIVNGIAITPERAKRVAFSTPIQTGVNQVIVSGPDFGAITSVADLSGKTVYVNPLTTYQQNLQKLNAELQKAGQAAHRHQGRRQEPERRRPDPDGARGPASGDRHHHHARRSLVQGVRQSSRPVRRSDRHQRRYGDGRCGRTIRS